MEFDYEEKYDIDIEDIQVDKRKFKKEWQGGRLRIRIGDPDRYVSGSQTYRISYTVKDAWLLEDEHTEFYWNLTGNDWEVPIESVQFEIEIPESLSLTPEDFRFFTGFTGQQGSGCS